MNFPWNQICTCTASMDCEYRESVLETWRHLIFIIFFSLFAICCSNECICNAVSPLKWFIPVSIRLPSLFCFSASPSLAFQLLSRLQVFISIFSLLRYVKAVASSCIFCIRKSGWKKDYSVIICMIIWWNYFSRLPVCKYMPCTLFTQHRFCCISESYSRILQEPLWPWAIVS